MGYILVGTIIGGIIWGVVVNKVIENKGYEENWFWWGFFFGIFALIIALTKQSVNTTKVVIESSAPVKENMELLSSCILNDQVNVSSPVHIASWEIKKDDEKLVLFVDFINVYQKAISAVMFSATGFNSFGDRVQMNDADFFDVIGQDLSIKPNECGKVYATLQYDAIRKVEVKVKKVCFADGTIVDDIQEDWISTNQSELKPIHIDCAKRENIQSKYYAIIKERYWQCVCGFVNTQNTCALCGMQKNNALKFTPESIEDVYNAYIKQIKIEKSKEESRKLEEKRLQEEQQARAKKNKKILAYSISIIAICVVVAIILNGFVIPNYKYNKAIKLINEQKHIEGIQLLSEIGGYKNASKIIQDYYSQFGSLVSATDFILGVKKDGKVVQAGKSTFVDFDTKNWENIKKVSVGLFDAVGLNKDGTVVYTGDNSDIKSKIASWSNIIEVEVGVGNIVGLKSDGTVVAIGNNNVGQSDVSDWEDIISISVNGYHTVGLKSDGTVVATGNNDYGQCNVSSWKNIVAVSSGELYTIGLKSNGKLIAVGDNSKACCEVTHLNNIVAISASPSYAVALKADGRTIAIGNNTTAEQRVLSNWNDIVSVCVGDGYTVGLKRDGSLVSTGYTDISSWDLLD